MNAIRPESKIQKLKGKAEWLQQKIVKLDGGKNDTAEFSHHVSADEFAADGRQASFQALYPPDMREHYYRMQTERGGNETSFSVNRYPADGSLEIVTETRKKDSHFTQTERLFVPQGDWSLLK